jgi:hypothetical protein
MWSVENASNNHRRKGSVANHFYFSQLALTAADFSASVTQEHRQNRCLAAEPCELCAAQVPTTGFVGSCYERIGVMGILMATNSSWVSYANQLSGGFRFPLQLDGIGRRLQFGP